MAELYGHLLAPIHMQDMDACHEDLDSSGGPGVAGAVEGRPGCFDGVEGTGGAWACFSLRGWLVHGRNFRREEVVC